METGRVAGNGQNGANGLWGREAQKTLEGFRKGQERIKYIRDWVLQVKGRGGWHGSQIGSWKRGWNGLIPPLGSTDSGDKNQTGKGTVYLSFWN